MYLSGGRFGGIRMVSGMNLVVGVLGAGKLGVGGIGVWPGARGGGSPCGVWRERGSVGLG